MIHPETFVDTLLTVMNMLNELPRTRRHDLSTQLGLIWIAISDPRCAPGITFTELQQEEICRALQRYTPGEKEQGNFPYTYESIQEYYGNAHKKASPSS